MSDGYFKNPVNEKNLEEWKAELCAKEKELDEMDRLFMNGYASEKLINKSNSLRIHIDNLRERIKKYTPLRRQRI